MQFIEPDGRLMSTHIYFVYNKKSLESVGFHSIVLTPSVFTHCMFCNAPRWHNSMKLGRLNEVIVCDTCNNLIRAQRLTIDTIE